MPGLRLDQTRHVKIQFARIIFGPLALAFLPVLVWGVAGTGVAAVVTLISLIIIASSYISKRRFGPFWRGKLLPNFKPVVQNEDLEIELEKAMQNHLAGEVYAACFAIEIDGFDAFKRTHGVRAGAAVFREICFRLQNTFRRSDTVARISATGLAVSTQTDRKIDPVAALNIAERVREKLAKPIVVAGTMHKISCSVGFCVANRAPSETGKGMLDGANRAIEDALKDGTGNVRAYSKELGGVPVRPELAADVSRAFTNHEIVPFFQPQICATTGQVTGIEALARWKHPNLGIVPPLEFLNAVALADQWVDLTDTMIDGALSALVNFDRLGLDVPQVGVNFAQADLEHPQLIERIKWALDRFDLPAERLAIEVLESVVAGTDQSCAARTVAALSEMGCQIDLDDFGTGHASISTLRQFNVNRIKVDRSFVINVDQDGRQQEMMRTILMMAKQLRMETLAEGVETPGELQTLQDLGCHHIQGFGIAKPMPVLELQTWMTQRNANTPIGSNHPKSA